MSRAAVSGRAFVVAAVLIAGTTLAPRAGLAQEMSLLIEIGQDNPDPARPAGEVNDLRGLSLAFRGCFNPPPFGKDTGPVDLTFRVSFKRSGELFGKPRVVTFVQKITPDLRERYYTAVAEALDLCSPMPFSASMGAASAGRVFRVNFLDKRNSKRAETRWLTTTTN